MRGNEFLDKMGLIAPAYVEAADAKMNKKKSSWIKWDHCCLFCSNDSCGNNAFDAR